jgi:hypothetical protein
VAEKREARKFTCAASAAVPTKSFEEMNAVPGSGLVDTYMESRTIAHMLLPEDGSRPERSQGSSGSRYLRGKTADHTIMSNRTRIKTDNDALERD